MFITESWFWRGTQSAIFYYISCSPCVEFKYKRRRRKEATRAEREKAEIISAQPGLIVQPGPFQTNPDWAEEIIMGPGPPKGWKKEKILQGYSESARERYRNETHTPHLPSLDFNEAEIANGEGPSDCLSWPATQCVERQLPAVTFSDVPLEPLGKQPLSRRRSLADPMSPISEATSKITISTASSSDQAEQLNRPRPSMERRLSSAVENIKGTFKGWNLKRYEREDEILSGLNERISRMWDKATNYGNESGTEGRKVSFTYGRKRAGTTGTNESDRYDYQRAVRNPEINELHPPTVSKLPATRDEATWMLLPPPSAAVMAGRSRPQDEPALRWPLAVVGRDESEWHQLRSLRDVTHGRFSQETNSTSNPDLRRTPDLSNSSSDEEGWSDDEGETDGYTRDHKRHSAPVEGWMPVIPKAVAQILHPPTEPWREERVWG